ncbi:hypothetical protein D1007_57626 [Hordeum vulgare]|nr:hypothetical protein D1007_57626 [Hordeum vulgare]
MVTMDTKEQEDEAPEECVPHLPWMRLPVDIDSFSACPVACLPHLDPRDICINSPTGSGKTLAYALPIVQMLSTRKVKEVFDAIAPVVGLTLSSAVGQSSIADEISDMIKKSKQDLYPSLDDEYVETIMWP